MEFETELERIAQQYRDEGYVVITHPDRDHLPAFADFGADLLATRGHERVLVQVKRSRADVEADESLARRAEVIGTQPGWRYDLIVLRGGDPLRRILRGAREPSREEIGRGLAEVEALIQGGQHRAALVIAWAALEATIRQATANHDQPGGAPAELLSTLYGNGVLSREEFDRLREGFRLRTEIVHGLVSPPVEPQTVREVVATVRRLLDAGAPVAA